MANYTINGTTKRFPFGFEEANKWAYSLGLSSFAWLGTPATGFTLAEGNFWD